MELERCERLVDEGMTAPLQDAREAVKRLERQQEEALATLHSLGYRATLHRPPDSDRPSSPIPNP